MPGRVMSSMYRARPVTLSTPSLRGTGIPTMGSGFTRSYCEGCQLVRPVTDETPVRGVLGESCRLERPVVLEDKFASRPLASVRPDRGTAHGDNAGDLVSR